MQNSSPASPPVARRHTRFRCNQRVSVRYRMHDREAIAYGRCTVVGKGGIGAILKTAQLEVGQEVSLEIVTSGVAATVALKAQVKDRHGLNHGFEFLEKDGRVTVMLQTLFQPEALIFSLPTPSVAPLFSEKPAQRRYPRVPGDGELTLILQSGAAESQIPARLVEIGQGGFRVSHNHAHIEVGRQLMVVYVGVSMLCNVVWHHAAGGHFETGLAVLDSEEN